MSAPERLRRTHEADARCAAAYAASAAPETGVALVAVGGYGRSELAPCSDLHVVLVSDEGGALDGVAQQVWYPGRRGARVWSGTCPGGCTRPWTTAPRCR